LTIVKASMAGAVVSGENFEKQEKRESVMYNAFA
jgi:hypothetical protein